MVGDLQRLTTPYDSHPALRQRFELLATVDADPSSPQPHDSAPAWTLLPDVESYQQRLTHLVERDIKSGVGQYAAIFR